MINSSYHKRNKERLQEKPYHQEVGNEKAEEYYKNNKRSLEEQTWNKYTESWYFLPTFSLIKST